MRRVILTVAAMVLAAGLANAQMMGSGAGGNGGSGGYGGMMGGGYRRLRRIRRNDGRRMVGFAASCGRKNPYP